VIKADTELNVAENIMAFRHDSILQQGVLSLLSNLMATSGELQEYIKMFEKLDTSHDGNI
jgi:calcium-dependent protein kinase